MKVLVIIGSNFYFLMKEMDSHGFKVTFTSDSEKGDEFSADEIDAFKNHSSVRVANLESSGKFKVLSYRHGSSDSDTKRLIESLNFLTAKL